MIKKERMAEQINQHGKNLLNIFGDSVSCDPVKLCKKLRSIEFKAARITTDLCNGVIEQDAADWRLEMLEDVLDKVLRFREQKIPVFINRDPRGYALKIDDEYVRERNLSIYRDWGGYGILAPEFTGD